MTGVRHILLALFGLIGLLSASAWSADASACRARLTGAVVAAKPMHHQHHRPVPASGHKAPTPSDARIDCAACMGVLPVFPAIGSRELMPFTPVADAIEPLTGIRPALDPPPPRSSED